MIGCQSLKNDGFKENIWNLEGGIYNWSSSGFSVKSKH
jgi:rhodanese-related sulfurtransferase